MGLTRMAIAVSAIALSASGAFAADWKLVEVAGVVRVAPPGKTAAPAAANQALPVGSIVTTAAGGRAALFNGKQRITLGPNSRMSVAPESNDGMTRVMQDLGSILFQIDKKPSQHFRVETPLLAAVVKGTTFTVNVEFSADSVHVAEGLVEVHANQGSATHEVGAGATGVVSRDTPEQLKVETPQASVDAPLPAQTVSLDYGAVSAGLVDGPEAAGAGLATIATAPGTNMSSAVATEGAAQSGPPAPGAAMMHVSLAASGDAAASSASEPPGATSGNPGQTGGNAGSGVGAGQGSTGGGNAGGGENGANGNGNAGDAAGAGQGNSGNNGTTNTGGAGNNGSGNGNAGGQGNGNGNSGNGNTGGVGNNGSTGNGNAGGNGNGNAGDGATGAGQGNGVPGANGNGNAGGAGNNGSTGNGNGNAGGNGNGNGNAGDGATGAGQGNAGNGNVGNSGNGNGGGAGNAGSNANGNAGGNGNAGDGATGAGQGNSSNNGNGNGNGNGGPKG